jgi:hypothetical protein
VATAALALGATPAFAAKSCARQIIDDWYKDGRVDRIYDLHCYEEAIDELPEDVLQYSSAREDIERALQDALRKGAPAGPTDDDSSDDAGAGSPPSTSGDDSDGDATNRPSPEPTEQPETRATPETPTTTPREPDAGTETPEAIGEVESSDAGSVPLPLIVLGGLALLLLAAGGAGYLNRRLHARRADGDVAPPADL